MDVSDVRLPFHEAQWRRIDAFVATRRVPHALLLKGVSGLGKSSFADGLVRVLLCEAPSPQPCGQCRPCQLLQAETHPDAHRVEPVEEGKAIGIEQIRELIGSLSLTSMTGTRKVGLLMPAESMTLSAANSLLKTLEEPPGDSVLILVSNAAGLLPATIRSRCQAIDFAACGDETTITWLARQLPADQDAAALLRLAHGRPLVALTAFESGLSHMSAELRRALLSVAHGKLESLGLAEIWSQYEPQQVLSELVGSIAGLVSVRLGVTVVTSSATDSIPLLQATAKRLDLEGLFEFYDKCLALQRLFQRHTGLNKALQLEQLADDWQRTTRVSR